MNEWISVKERLPDKTDSFLVVLEGKYIGIRTFNSKNDPVENWSTLFNKFIDYDSRGDSYSDTNVTHWMPVPELPKRGRKRRTT